MRQQRKGFANRVSHRVSQKPHNQSKTQVRNVKPGVKPGRYNLWPIGPGEGEGLIVGPDGCLPEPGYLPKAKEYNCRVIDWGGGEGLIVGPDGCLPEPGRQAIKNEPESATEPDIDD